MADKLLVHLPSKLISNKDQVTSFSMNFPSEKLPEVRSEIGLKWHFLSLLFFSSSPSYYFPLSVPLRNREMDALSGIDAFDRLWSLS